jgi:hypothetical protein
MRTIRRFYFYAVAFISLEVVLWGLIGLLRSVFVSSVIGGSATRLAESLALILVGMPVFGLHWGVVQRDARREMDEHNSGLRAFFLYAVLLSTIIPAIQSFLAVINRLFLDASHLSRLAAVVGGQQNWSDNLIALLMNILIATYFITVLRLDWKQITIRESFNNVRRIYRYIWVLYGLGLTIAGVQQILLFILQIPPSTFGALLRADFINGLALTLVGTPLWVWAWKTVQDSLLEPAEHGSLLRLGLLYVLSLVGVITVLTSGGIALDLLLRQFLGEKMLSPDFVQRLSSPLSIGIPLAGVWSYYGHWLARSMNEVPDAPRRSGMRRLYAYILSAIGVGAAFVGLRMVLAFVVDASLGGQAWGGTLRLSLAAALSTLGVALPLWLMTWRPMQSEALSSGDAGDHARRSLVRRFYIYLALFASVIGGMTSAGILVYLLLSALLGGGASNVLQGSLKALETLALFILLGVYHGLTLRKDGETTGRALSEKHASYPVLIFDPGDGFGPALLTVIQKASPRLPAGLQPIDQPVADSAKPSAVVLPSDVALDPPAELRVWLENFKGTRLVVPRALGNWTLVGQPVRMPVNQAAQILRQLAEGQELRASATPAWLIAIYIVAGLISLPMLVSLVGTFISASMR